MDILQQIHSLESDEWICVGRKKAKPRNEKSIVKCINEQTLSTPLKKVQRDDAINGAKLILQKYNLHDAFLFGSTAKQTNTVSSDVDILVIWKKMTMINKCNLINLHDELVNYFKKRVDVTHMCITDIVDQNDDSNLPIFIDNVLAESCVIFGAKTNIRLSKYLGKHRTLLLNL